MQEEISQNGTVDPVSLKQSIIDWAHQLGFQDIRISNAGADMSSVEAGLSAWLAMGFHGDMDYMAKHGIKRTRPNELVPGTSRVISVRMNYLPSDSQESWV